MVFSILHAAIAHDPGMNGKIPTAQACHKNCLRVGACLFGISTQGDQGYFMTACLDYFNVLLVILIKKQ
jgi:hypothetical protein